LSGESHRPRQELSLRQFYAGEGLAILIYFIILQSERQPTIAQTTT